MTWSDAILTVLRETGEPMAYKDVAAEILRRHLADPGVRNVDILTHAEMTRLQNRGLVASAPRGKYRISE